MCNSIRQARSSRRCNEEASNRRWCRRSRINRLQTYLLAISESRFAVLLSAIVIHCAIAALIGQRQSVLAITTTVTGSAGFFFSVKLVRASATQALKNGVLGNFLPNGEKPRWQVFA